jgi:hypothetical protein
MPGGYFLAGRTSQKPEKGQSIFGEPRLAVVQLPRIPIPRTRVHKGKKGKGASYAICPFSSSLFEKPRSSVWCRKWARPRVARPSPANVDP